MHVIFDCLLIISIIVILKDLAQTHSCSDLLEGDVVNMPARTQLKLTMMAELRGKLAESRIFHND